MPENVFVSKKQECEQESEIFSVDTPGFKTEAIRHDMVKLT
jgi:hypothetical protein